MSLSDFDNDWQQSQGRHEEWNPPPGVYQVEIDKVEVTETKKKQPMVIFHMIILGGTFEGLTFKKVETIRSAMNVDFLKGDFDTLGVNLQRLSDLPQMTNVFAGMKCEVKTVEKQGAERTFTNVYIQRKLEEGQALPPNKNAAYRPPEEPMESPFVEGNEPPTSHYESVDMEGNTAQDDIPF